MVAKMKVPLSQHRYSRHRFDPNKWPVDAEVVCFRKVYLVRSKHSF